MADSLLAMADLVADALDVSDAEVTNLVQAVPLLDMLPMEESSNGETHKISVETGSPTVGFRAPNTGRDFSKSADTIVTVTLKLIDFSYAIDKGVADIWRKGGKDALIDREGMRHLKAALTKFEKQLIYGTNATHGDATGFTGMVNATTVDGLSDEMVVDAGGTTINTATSVWALAIGPNDVMGVVNGEGAFDIGEPHLQDIVDATGKHFPAYWRPACTWGALSVGSAFSMGRIVNITEDVGKGLTDSLLSQLLERFPITHRPTALFMNRRSLGQLQRSRTATNPTGAEAPFPDSAFGLPIVTLESLVNTEALVV